MTRRRAGAGAAVVVLLAWLVTGWAVYVTPRTDPLPAGAHVDAVVALGGKVESADDALRLGASGAAGTVVLSDPYDRDDPQAVRLHQACDHPPPAFTVICFDPDPATTRGEAEEVRRLVAARGWRSVAVVAPVFHVARARLMMQRCAVPGLRMVPTTLDEPWWGWAYQFAYQTLGFAKAAVLQGC